MELKNNLLSITTRDTSGPRFELPIEPAGYISDPDTWFGRVNLATLGLVSPTDPSSVILDGFFNNANKPGSVVFVSKAAFDSLDMHARTSLIEVIYFGTIPLPQVVGDPERHRVTFDGVIELESSLNLLLFSALSDWVQIRLVD